MTDPIVWSIMLPLLASLLALAWPNRAAAAALAGAILGLLASIALLIEIGQHATVTHHLGGWLPGLGIALRADALSALLLVMAMLVVTATTFYAGSYFSDRAQAQRFWPLWMMLVAAISALLLSGDLFNLYVTLELLGLSAVALAALGNSRASLEAAIRYLTVGLLGSMAFLAGVALIYGGYGTLDLRQLAQQAEPEILTLTALGLMTSGLLIKAALFPLHFWLPAAHSSAPAPVSAALSALVVKVSVYLLVRLWLDIFEPALPGSAGLLLGALGSAAVLWGSWQAYRAERLKLLAAYSTVAQVGYLFLFLAVILGMTDAALRQQTLAALLVLALTHGFAKSALFLCAGVVLHRAGHDRIADLGGTARALPMTTFVIALSCVALIGLPPSGTFLAKWHLISDSITTGQWWWIPVIMAGSLLAAAYSFRVLGHAFAPGESSGPMVHWAREELPALTLALFATVVLGLGAAGIWDLVAAGDLYPGAAS